MEASARKSLLKAISFRCYSELNDFLPAERKQKSFTLCLKTPVTVGEVIAYLGIPFSEVDLVLVNSYSAASNQRLYENDRVSLFPTFESFDISSLKASRQKPLRETRFILDAHLGKLAKYLRMLGFDTLYRNDYGDEEIIEIAFRENRIILTRDKQLLGSARVIRGYFVRSTEKHAQLKEVVNKFDLYSQFLSFTRCMTCNTRLVPVSSNEIKNKINADTARIFNQFFYCDSCDKVYWKGSHFERMEKLILSLIRE